MKASAALPAPGLNASGRRTNGWRLESVGADESKLTLEVVTLKAVFVFDRITCFGLMRGRQARPVKQSRRLDPVPRPRYHRGPMNLRENGLPAVDRRMLVAAEGWLELGNWKEA